jgi:hypothetical protein
MLAGLRVVATARSTATVRDVPDPAVHDSLVRQAVSCDHIGSPLYGALFRDLAADHAAGGITAELLDGLSELPVHDALPLRYAGAVHALALTGRGPELAAQYPSCGGTWSGNSVAPQFLAVVRRHVDVVRTRLQHQVQTNEVGRAVVLHAGMCWLAARWDLPVRTLEIGASGGLLSHWPSYHYDTGSWQGGDPDSPLRFGPEWYTTPPPPMPAPQVHDRRASDVAPIDPTTEAGRITMQSFVWPDQPARLERLRTAMAIAAARPVVPDRADAADWATIHLRGGATDTTHGTVLFHSIVWQYLGTATRTRLREALWRAGNDATADRPVAWLRMEPATTEHADLRVTVWPGTVEVHLADVGYHGADIRWLA